MTDDPHDSWPIVRFGRNHYVVQTDRSIKGYAAGGNFKLFDPVEPISVIDRHPPQVATCSSCGRVVIPHLGCYDCR